MVKHKRKNARDATAALQKKNTRANNKVNELYGDRYPTSPFFFFVFCTPEYNTPLHQKKNCHFSKICFCRSDLIPHFSKKNCCYFDTPLLQSFCCRSEYTVKKTLCFTFADSINSSYQSVNYSICCYFFADHNLLLKKHYLDFTSANSKISKTNVQDPFIYRHKRKTQRHVFYLYFKQKQCNNNHGPRTKC